ncbi:hypothetical protein KA107_01585 [Candidatus Pacearchaeota archaeon]|nr:hypothetical protein [Candidatus Pacearchaeota archaeon]
MKKEFSLIFIMVLFFSLNLVLADFSLPSPPAAPSVGSSNVSNNTSVGYVPPSYPPIIQNYSSVNNSNVSTSNGLQSNGIFWAWFVGIIILLVITAGIIIYVIRKNRSG